VPIPNNKIKINPADIKTSEKSRDSGFELMRIISIIMIVALHLLGHGGILDYVGNSNYAFWTIEAFVSVAVNCYVLLSGYFLITSNFKLKKLFWLYFQVVFYTLAIYIIFVCINLAPFDYKKLIQVLLPISSRRYWFISCYIGLYLLVPFLNKLILNLNKKQTQILILLLFLFFCRFNVLLPIFSTLNTDNGYGLVWFVCLYCFSSYIRLHYNRKINKYIYLLLYIIICMLTSLLHTKLGIENLYYYSSVTIFLSSVFLFLFFRELDLKNPVVNKAIYTLAPLSLGVYLISDNRYIRSVLYTDIINVNYFISRYNIFIVFLLFIIVVFTVSSAIEYARKNILFKNLKNNKKINSFFNSLQNRFLI